MEENKIYIETDRETKINTFISEGIGVCIALIFMLILLFYNVVDVEDILLNFILAMLATLVVFFVSFVIIRTILFVYNMIKKNGLRKLMKVKFH